VYIVRKRVVGVEWRWKQDPKDLESQLGSFFRWYDFASDTWTRTSLFERVFIFRPLFCSSLTLRHLSDLLKTMTEFTLPEELKIVPALDPGAGFERATFALG
jgi:hypothetical protein